MIYNNSNVNNKKICVLLTNENVKKLDHISNITGYSRGLTLNKIINKINVKKVIDNIL